VTENRIEGWIDNEKLINVLTADKRIAVRPGEIELSQPFGICSWQTTSALREIKMRRVEAPPARPQNKFTDFSGPPPCPQLPLRSTAETAISSGSVPRPTNEFFAAGNISVSTEHPSTAKAKARLSVSGWIPSCFHARPVLVAVSAVAVR